MKPLIIRILLAAAVLFFNVSSTPAAEAITSAPHEASSSTVSAGKVATTAPQTTGYYLTSKERVFAAFPAAPRLNSERDHTDLLITLTMQSCRNSDQIEEAKSDAKYGDAIKAIGHIVDPAFETTYPDNSKVAQLLKHAGDDGAIIMRMLKKRNARPRPFIQHSGLVIPLFTVGDFSYPSGHATGSELQARILSELFPDHADELMKKAKLIADSRVVAGVHYESDIEAGSYLGDLIYSALSTNAKFVHDLDAAKAELAR